MSFRSVYIILILWVLPASVWSQQNLLPDTIRYCLGDSAKIEIISHFGDKTTVSWETPAGKYGNTRKVRPYKPGKYYVKVSSPNFFKPLTDSAYVRVYAKPVLHLKDSVLCKGKSLLLDAKNPGCSYLWSTGETSSKIKVQNPGRYWVKITNGSCHFLDTVLVKSPEGSATTIAPEALFCLNDEVKNLTVKTAPNTKIVWNTGATSASIPLSREGTYWVKTEATGSGCGPQVDTVKVKFKACDCEMFIPNSFTPNEDNRNDYFFPVTQCDYSYYQLTISDRWGNTVFSTGNINGRWDGRFKGNLCPEDIYVYIIECTEKQTEKKIVRKGHVSLFR